MRDKQNDFKAPILQKLKNRVGNVCSNAACYAPTSGAKTGDEEGVLNMGIGAHICAASPGGPRFDPDMTPAQRAAYKNGVWLCIPCSNKIDKDPLAYPVELLHQWKRTAEKRSQTKIGVPAQPDSAPQDLLVSAFSGMSLKSGLAQAINNVHGAVEKSMGEIDNRFHVQTTYLNGQTTYHIAAREDVPITMQLKDPRRYVQGYRQLVEEGKTLVIDSKDVMLVGSPLFERIAAESQRLQIGALTKPCTVKISTVDAVTGRVESFDDIQGQFVSGTVSGTFTGYTMHQMLKFEMVMKMTLKGQINITVTPFMEHWNGLSVDCLPYFSKLRSLLLNINNGHSLSVTLEHQGEHVLSGVSVGISFKKQFDNIKMLFLYLDAARDIARFTKTRILFDDMETISGEKIDDLIEIAAVTRRDFVKHERDFKNRIRFEVQCEGDAKHQIAMFEEERDLIMRITQISEDVISVFGQQVKMPRKTVQFAGARTIVTNKKSRKKDGYLKCEVIPKEGFTLESFYLNEKEEKAETSDLKEARPEA
ncbi:hypothetical protein [Stutzerimonas nitrititolerans]|uniref:hypothetical protein n=1 Tax=Stutzerimonas nitrititolerans TaxID=2482751 RepID=UPI00289CFB84|nr:hypothetical protein [Stutzerimonas nitrititolerans]